MYCSTCSEPTLYNVHVTLDSHCQLKILAYLNAYINGTSADVISFDIDTKEATLDIGCSRTLTYDRSDFITYRPCTGEVEGLGKHDIIGLGTVQFSVVTDNGNTTPITIHDAIYIPTLDVRLISIQKYCQQTLELSTEAVLVKSVPYNVTGNLPILCTAPGAQRPSAYISKHLSPWNKDDLFKDKQNDKWDSKLIHGSNEILSPELESTVHSATTKLNTKHVNTFPQPL